MMFCRHPIKHNRTIYQKISCKEEGGKKNIRNVLLRFLLRIKSLEFEIKKNIKPIKMWWGNFLLSYTTSNNFKHFVAELDFER